MGDHYKRKKCSVFINREETEVEVFGFLFFFYCNRARAWGEHLKNRTDGGGKVLDILAKIFSP